MRISFATINFDEGIARKTIEALLKIPPFDSFFYSERPVLMNLNLGPEQIEQSWLLNIEDIARNNQVDNRDTTDKDGERRVIFTNNRIFHFDMFPSPLLYGAAMSHYGLAFVRPVNPCDLEKEISTPNLSYTLELAAHELGGTLVYSPGEWEKCADKKCFAYGIGRLKGKIIHPPRGRNHFCREHQKYMIERVTHSGIYLEPHLKKHCELNGIKL